MKRRVLVTGWRYLKDRQVVEEALWAQARIAGGLDRLIVIQGECPYGGADLFAKEWAIRHGVEHEDVPADFKSFGKAAGPIRNSVMVASGADVCIAFPRGEARGTGDCIDKAKAAGIPVITG